MPQKAPQPPPRGQTNHLPPKPRPNPRRTRPDAPESRHTQHEWRAESPEKVLVRAGTGSGKVGRGGASIRMEVGAGFFAEDQGRKWAAAGCARAGSGTGSPCGHRFGAAESAGLGLRVPRGRVELVVDVVHLRDDFGELRLLEDERKRRLRRPPRAAVADGDHAESQRPQRNGSGASCRCARATGTCRAGGW